MHQPHNVVYDVLYPKVDVIVNWQETFEYYPGEDKGDICKLYVTVRRPDGAKMDMAGAQFAVRTVHRGGHECFQGDFWYNDSHSFELEHPKSIVKVIVIPRVMPKGWLYSVSLLAKRI